MLRTAPAGVGFKRSQPAPMLTSAAVVPMRSIRTGVVEFELIIYGRTAASLMTVPNDVIGSLAERYPGHQSSIFDLYDLERPYARR